MAHQFVLILDFGGQYNQLIARRVRECGVYCEVHSYKKTIEEIKAFNPVGIIFTGGPNSVYSDNSPKIDKAIFELGIPVLGLCYGSQLMAHTLGGEVKSATNRVITSYSIHYTKLYECSLFRLHFLHIIRMILYSLFHFLLPGDYDTVKGHVR